MGWLQELRVGYAARLPFKAKKFGKLERLVGRYADFEYNYCEVQETLFISYSPLRVWHYWVLSEGRDMYYDYPPPIVYWTYKEHFDDHLVEPRELPHRYRENVSCCYDSNDEVPLSELARKGEQGECGYSSVDEAVDRYLGSIDFTVGSLHLADSDCFAYEDPIRRRKAATPRDSLLASLPPELTEIVGKYCLRGTFDAVTDDFLMEGHTRPQ